MLISELAYSRLHLTVFVILVWLLMKALAIAIGVAQKVGEESGVFARLASYSLFKIYLLEYHTMSSV